MNSKEKISIVVASDNTYAVMIAALIKSIEINHKTDELIDVFIIDDGISRNNKKKISKSFNCEIITLNWIQSKSIVPPQIKLPSDTSSLPFTTYMRLFAPYISDIKTDKLLYLDVDMLLYDDISKLYNTDIGSNIIGAVQDIVKIVSASFAITNYKDLGIPADTKYFNAGLILINKKKWIENEVTQKVIDYVHNNINHVFHADQTGLNAILYNSWFEINEMWNYSTDYDIIETTNKPSLIHFLSIKPIFDSYASSLKHKQEFFRILKLTDYKDFTPISNRRRMLKKAFNKLKKNIYSKFNKV